MVKYDVHVAAEGSGDKEFEQSLLELGFSSDNLLSRRVTYLKGVALSSCPLIGTHMTKKYDTPSEIMGDMERVRGIMEKYGQVGYVHGESISLDNTIISKEDFDIVRPWPIHKVDSKIDNENKKWDIHIALPKENTPEELKAILNYDISGFYSMDLNKTRDEREQPFRIYTMQGISDPKEGRKLWRELNNWFIDINAPHVEIKLEAYIGMFRVGNPRIVPPTTKEIKYK